MKKVASILLCAAIFLSLCIPASATATETEPEDFDQLTIGNIVILVDPSYEAEQASEFRCQKGKPSSPFLLKTFPAHPME